MQAESEIVMNLPEDEGDDLFGSPPSSPARGRSPSPGLALPSRSNGISLVSQNVGTIALPGQHSSELAVHSVALPFSDPLVGLSRPPAPLPSSACGYDQSDISRPASRSSTSTPSSSRASSMAPSNAKQKKRKAKSVLSSQSSRPPTTEIPLPDPSAPLPANWLRSQSALLGHAGLVGGVKAAHLSRNRGSTLSNPIIVDDPEEKRATQKQQPLRPVITYATLEGLNLPAPSTQDIVDILIKQKEVFPILQDILKLYSREAALHGPHFWANQNDLPAFKRRKLNNVPAGAVDWDVPFPFQHGEGPQKYRAEWVQERAKHLVAQLVALIKTASRKAALRNYLNQENGIREQLDKSRQQANDLPSIKKELEHSLPKTNGHYKPATALYGTNMSNLPANTTHSSTTLTPTALARDFSLADQSSNPPSSTVDQVITSLLNNQNTAKDRSDQPSLHESDDWLAFLEALQTSETTAGTAPNTAQAASPETPTTTDGDLSMDLPWLPEHSNSSFNPSPIDSSSFSSPDVDAIRGHDTYSSSHDLSIDFDMCDMALPSIEELFGLQPEPYPDHLSISIPQTSGPPSLVASPMPSMSSMGDFPSTPTSSVAFDFNDITMGPGDVPDDVMNAVSSLIALGDGKGSGGESVSGKQLEPYRIPASRLNSEVVHDEGEHVGGSGGGQQQQQQGKQRPELSDSHVVEVNKVLPLLMTSIGTSSIGTSSIFTPNIPKTYQPSTTPVDRAEILRRAREMRKQLADEIVKTRTQLWETTIEHGVLTHMAKYYK